MRQNDNSNFLLKTNYSTRFCSKHGRRPCFLSKFCQSHVVCTESHGIQRDSTEIYGIPRNSAKSGSKPAKTKHTTKNIFGILSKPKKWEKHKKSVKSGSGDRYPSTWCRSLCPVLVDPIEGPEIQRIQGGRGAPALCLRKARTSLLNGSVAWSSLPIHLSDSCRKDPLMGNPPMVNCQLQPW